MGTPAYMSPEQARGDLEHLGPPSDVYGLGATLYCLLTGRAPFSGDPIDVIPRVQRGDFPPPRQIDPSIDPALEAVCLKAMAPDPGQRYGSPRALAEDVERWLADEPVSAYRESWAMRAGRWARRHRPLVAGAVALLATAVVALSVGTVLLRGANAETDRQRRLAIENLDQARANLAQAEANFALARDAVDRFYTRVSEDKLLNEPHMDRLRKDLLGSAREFYRTFAEQRKGDPKSQADLGRAYRRLARIARDLGESREALDNAEQSRAIFERLARRHPEEIPYRMDLARSLFTLGEVCSSATRYSDAEDALKMARTIQEELLRTNPELAENRQELAMTDQRLGALYHDMGHFVEAEQRALAALDLRRKLAAAHPDLALYQSQLAQAYNNLSALYGRMRRGPDAVEAGLASLAINQHLVAAHPGITEYRENLGRVHGSLGGSYSAMGRLPEIEEHERAALAIFEELGAAHPEITSYQMYQALFHRNLGETYLRMGRLAQAEASLKAALARREKLAAAHPERLEYVAYVGSSETSLGALAERRGDPAAALGWYGRSIALLDDALRREPRHMLSRLFLERAFWGRAEALSRLGRHAEAIADCDRALGLDDGSEGDQIRLDRAIVLARAGDHARSLAEADPLARSRTIPPADRAYKLARLFARAAAAIGDDPKVAEIDRASRADMIAARAVGQLGQARHAGSFGNPESIVELRTDPDLNPLRARRDFQLFLMDVTFPADPFHPAQRTGADKTR
jgi:serine/threonine-protein kinase